MLHGAAAASFGVAVTTTFGGIGVVVLTIVAALLIPAFVRYRVGQPKGRDATPPTA